MNVYEKMEEWVCDNREKKRFQHNYLLSPTPELQAKSREITMWKSVSTIKQWALYRHLLSLQAWDIAQSLRKKKMLLKEGKKGKGRIKEGSLMCLA